LNEGLILLMGESKGLMFPIGSISIKEQGLNKKLRVNAGVASVELGFRVPQ